jgi:predicted PhzF superfamily epimerase YddE/YHI9
VAGARLAFRAPPLIRQGPLTAAELADALAILQLDAGAVIDAVHVDNGPPWKLIRLASAAAVLGVHTIARAKVGVDIGVIGPSDAAGVDWEVRAFFSKQGGVLVEDPVTGSFNAGVAQYLYGAGLASGDYVAAQGRCVGADGRVFVSRDADGVWIGGDVWMVVQGGSLNG